MAFRSAATRWIINILILASMIAGILNVWLISRQQNVVLDTNSITSTIFNKLNIGQQQETVFEQRVVEYGDRSDDRPLLTEDFIGCETEVYVSTAFREISYMDQEHGFVLDLPYSPSWGSKDFRIAPFAIDEDALRFGELFPNVRKDCAWERAYELRYIPARSLDSAVRSAEVRIAEGES
ncbi:hypothetical protein GF380_01975, partial [Candidatus Uhrbacteria bacterium]|nr:hypothetical protein [Candidatus Uhrbacteria bacterium]MBD3284002.1 hypothetical protein [Candidatus Uhrbacteria bacterium]